MLQVGSRIQAKLIEEVEKDHWIVSFQGQLLQVRNTTSIPFTKSQMLDLQVVKSNPIQLKVLSSSKSRPFRLNIVV